MTEVVKKMVFRLLCTHPSSQKITQPRPYRPYFLKVEFRSARYRVRSDDGKKLLPGTLVDIGSGGSSEQESEFFPGQLLGGGDADDENVNGNESFGDIKFVAGQWGEEDDGAGGGFVLGQIQGC